MVRGNRLESNLIFVIIVLFMLTILCPVALWAEEGAKKWVFPAEGAVGSITSSPAIGPDGTIYVGSGDSKVYAIQPDGTKKWESETGGAVSSSPALGYFGGILRIYVGSEDNKVYAINADGTAATGAWPFVTGGKVTSSPAINNSGIMYVGSEDNKVYAIKIDGTAQEGEWPFVTEGKVTSSPAIDSDGTIYVGSHDHKVYAIKSNGKKKWEFETKGVVSSSPAIRESGDTKVIYVGSEDGKVYALNPDDGQKTWEFPAEGEESVGAIHSSPAVDGISYLTLFVGSNDATLYAINLTTGIKTWGIRFANEAIRSSPAIGSDGTIYVGSDDGSLYARKSDGTEKWEFVTPGGGKVSSSPTIGFGGDVYVGTEDGKLYAIESSSTRLADVAWPKFNHDVRNTARNNSNVGPTADAGTDQTVKSEDTVTLNGSNSSDPDYGIPLYTWTQTEGTSVTLSDSTAVKPTFTAPGVDENTTLTFDLTVTDNGRKTDTDTCKITVEKKDDGKGCFISTARGGVGY